MKLSEIAVLLALLCVSATGYVEAQQPATPQTAAAAPRTLVSALLQPSLDALQTALAAVKPEKWKGGTIRSEAVTNIASIQKDLQGALPALIAASDAAPGIISKALPVARNLDALYDVLIRVVDGSRVAAPGDQVDQLQQAMAGVEKARLSLSDHLQEMAAGSEKQIADLQASLKAQPLPVCPAVTAPPPQTPPAAKKKVVKKKPATPPGPKPPPQSQSPAKPNS